MDLTIPEATQLLRPEITAKDLRAIITALHWQATGHRHTGRSGHPHPLYPWGELSALHNALKPWLPGCDTSPESGTLCLRDASPDTAGDS